MIAWLQPSALWGLGLLALPVAIHLLRRRHAERVLFPSTRFLRPSRTAAIRLRPPSDLILLALRMAIVALAVLAAAQPLWLSPSRLETWNGRTARAVVVDTSESMKRARTDGRTAAEDAEAAAAAEGATALTFRVGHHDLSEGLRRARAWLVAAPPARREIVVISDFQHGALTASSIKPIEREIGLRFVRIGGIEQPAFVEGIPLLEAPGISGGPQRIHLTDEGTQLHLELGATSEPSAGLRSQGFRVLGGENEAGQRLLTTLALAGTPAPDPAQPIAVAFSPAAAPAGASHRFERWMIATVAGIEQDPELARLARGIEGAALPESDAWTVLLKDRRASPLVRAAAMDRELVLQVAAPVSSYFAAALSRAALNSRYGAVARPEHEVLSIPAETLLAWTRAPGPVDETAWRNSDASDARWLWVAALALLIAEQLMRSRTIARKDEARVAA
jgi:hypothetical protein